MNEAQQNAIALLDKLILAESGKRIGALFYPKSDDLYLEWMFVVGRHFRDAFDIKYTPKMKEKKKIKVWTQGSNFSVKEGYLFKMVHKPDWMLQVIDAVPAVSAGRGKERDKGYVKYQLIQQGVRSRELYETTQDDFIRILIHWDNPLVPLSQNDSAACVMISC